MVVQRVKSAKVVRVKDNKMVGEIGPGLFVLVGFKKGDTEESVSILSDKLVKLRVVSDSEDRMNLSVKDVRGSFLIVSQFTLYGDTGGGNRPSFINAEEPDKARRLYNLFVDSVKSTGIKTETGSFGDYMQIEADLDGPVTILYEL